MILYASLGLYALGYAMTFRRALWICTMKFQPGYRWISRYGYPYEQPENATGTRQRNSDYGRAWWVESGNFSRGVHWFWGAVSAMFIALAWPLVAPTYIGIKNRESFCHLNKVALPPKHERAKMKAEQNRIALAEAQKLAVEREARIAQLEKETGIA